MVFKKMMKTIKTIKTSKTTFLSFPSLPLFPKHIGSARQPLPSTSRGPRWEGHPVSYCFAGRKNLWGLDEVNKFLSFKNRFEGWGTDRTLESFFWKWTLAKDSRRWTILLRAIIFFLKIVHLKLSGSEIFGIDRFGFSILKFFFKNFFYFFEKIFFDFKLSWKRSQKTLRKK